MKEKKKAYQESITRLLGSRYALERDYPTICHPSMSADPLLPEQPFGHRLQPTLRNSPGTRLANNKGKRHVHAAAYETRTMEMLMW